MTLQQIHTHQQRKRLVLVLLFFTLLCIGIGAVRIVYTKDIKGVFLVWNLFLAWIPLLIGYSIKQNKIHPIKFGLVFLTWLLFLPNAPYIITDLIHLSPRGSVPIWFDAIVIFLFAFHGLILGIISTFFIHELLEKYFTKKIVWCFLISSFILCGFGVYLGRFLRWNSWDIITQPISLFQESLLMLSNPIAIVVTGIFSLIMFTSYLLFHQLIHLKSNVYDSKIH